MKNQILVLTALLYLACERQRTPPLVSPFTIKTYQIQLSQAIQSVVYSQGHYYCLLEDGQFICLDRKFQIDSTITKAMGSQGFDFAFLHHEQLGAARWSRDTIAEEYVLDRGYGWQKINRYASAPPSSSPKEPFSIYHCCVGEFGGAIFFEDNVSRRVYSCPATYVQAIHKIQNQYFITTCMPNGPSSEILLIKDPRKLYELKMDSLKNQCNWWTSLVRFRNGFAGMKKFEIGTKKLLDTLGILTFASFLYKGEFYHLCSDQSRLFLGKLVNGKMQVLDRIFTENLSTYIPVIGASDAGIAAPGRPTRSGFFAIQEDTISIVRIRYKAGG